MTIAFPCSTCGNNMQAPDSMAGQKVRCPLCQARIDVPQAVLEAEEVPTLPPVPVPLFKDFSDEPARRPSPAPPRPPGIPQRLEITPHSTTLPRPGEAAGAQHRRPCPMCGEMIVVQAIKCRFCGEVFDGRLRRGGRARGGYAGNGGPVASRGSRLGAAILDGILVIVLLFPAFLMLIAAGERHADPSVAAVGLLLLFGWLALMLAQVIMLSVQGQTLGKKAVGIRIVNFSDGGNPGFGGAFVMHSLVPAVLGFIPCFSLVDILWIFGEESRCLHDLIAGTCVVEV